jgi:hypothetical protein
MCDNTLQGTSDNTVHNSVQRYKVGPIFFDTCTTLFIHKLCICITQVHQERARQSAREHAPPSLSTPTRTDHDGDKRQRAEV